MKHHVITRTCETALVVLLLCCVTMIATGQDNYVSSNQPTKALPAQSTPVNLDGTDPEKLILEVRPLIKHVHPGEPLRIAMHVRIPSGPVSRDKSLTLDVSKTFSHMTFHVTRYRCEPATSSLSARIMDNRKKRRQQQKKLFQSATWFLHIHNDGFKSPQGISGTWTTDQNLDVTKPDQYGVKLKGQLVIDGKKVPFATDLIRFFSVSKLHGNTTTLRKAAQKTVKTTFSEKALPKNDKRTSVATRWRPFLGFEDRSGRLVFHFIASIGEEAWSFDLIRVHVSPEDEQVKELWTRPVKTTWSPALNDPWYSYWEPENPNWNAVDLPSTSDKNNADDDRANTDQNGKSCKEMIQNAKAHAEGQMCTSQVQELVCPHDDGHVYMARNGCEISYLKNRGWSKK